MLTGRQIRKARALLRWDVRDLAGRSGLNQPIVMQAESVDAVAPITLAQSDAIRRTIEREGLIFTLASVSRPKPQIVEQK